MPVAPNPLRVVVVALVAWAALELPRPVPVEAQFGAQRRVPERLLFLIPRPEAPSDSQYVIAYAEEARRRLEGKVRNEFAVIPTDQIAQMLAESGYPPNAILGPADAERLARALRADAYIEGELKRNDAPTARLRMVDIGRSGLSGWLTVQPGASADPRRLAEITADSMERHVEAAEEARECHDRRDRGDFNAALDRAQRAFRHHPNHPTAALCAAVVLEAQQAPVDSQIAMYERATRGDSLNARAWERLGRLYQQRGDSLAAVEAFAKQLLSRPDDRQLRLGIAAGFMTVGDHQRARELLEPWLRENPDDREFQDLLVRACVEGELWLCALDALARQYEMDSTLVGDTTFYGAVIGAAQAAGDPEALLRWTAEAVEHAPQSTRFWRARAAAFSDADMRDSVIATYEKILALEPDDVATRLAAAREIIEGLTIDTVVPLDTTSLFQAQQYLDSATAMSQDTSVLMNAAALYYQPAAKLVQLRRELPTAIEWLEKALANDVLGRLQEQANFFLGFALMFEIFEFDQQHTNAESWTCALVNEEAEMVARGREAVQIGRQVSPQTADQFLQQYANFEQRVAQLRQAFCR